MRSKLTPLLLIVCLFWQSIAFASMGIQLALPQQTDHAMMHMDDHERHHLEHTAVVQQHDVDDDHQHTMCDACLFAPALIPFVTHTLPDFESTSPAPLVLRAPVQPDPTGLERPPKHAP